MALAPRSSLRPLMLFLSRGKPQWSSFFSASAAVPPATACDDPPAAPTVNPPAAPVPPAGSSHEHPAPDQQIVNPIRDRRGPLRSLQSEIDKPPRGTFEDNKNPIPDGPRSAPRPGIDEPSPDTVEDPKHPTPYGSCSTAIPVIAKPPSSKSEIDKPLPLEDIKNPIRDGLRSAPMPGAGEPSPDTHETNCKNRPPLPEEC